MRITDLKCAVIGDNPVVRIVTDAGISGYAAAESYKPYLKPHVRQRSRRWNHPRNHPLPPQRGQRRKRARPIMRLNETGATEFTPISLAGLLSE